MSSIAIYRLPYQEHCTLVEQSAGEPAELLSCSELNGCEGFVVAPFEVSPQQPILLIRPDRVTRLPVGQLSGLPAALADQFAAQEQFSGAYYAAQQAKGNYAIDFANFHAQLQAGVFQKIVLARCVAHPRAEEVPPLALFQKACQLYPRMFICLVATPRSGVWLTATPEILLQGQGRQWHTIALAGTMKMQPSQLGLQDSEQGAAASWTVKDIREQRIVATYVTECLEQFTGDFREEATRTVRAANLIHLRSDFTFTLPDADHIGDLLLALHPTPAICGLPKRETFKFIVQNEHTPRCYYSGFMGMLSPKGDTDLFVSLRCMNITRNAYLLYAGGGLLTDSSAEQEWNETEAKLEVMRALIGG